jgi:hypothetical protein
VILQVVYAGGWECNDDIGGSLFLPTAFCIELTPDYWCDVGEVYQPISVMYNLTAPFLPSVTLYLVHYSSLYTSSRQFTAESRVKQRDGGGSRHSWLQ